MTFFHKKKKLKDIFGYLPIILLVMALGLLIICSHSFSDANLSQEKEVLQNALDRSITQCYALEGTYPVNLTYLEENYGLTYNKDHFFIDYTYIGGNLRPDITIIERD